MHIDTGGSVLNWRLLPVVLGLMMCSVIVRADFPVAKADIARCEALATAGEAVMLERQAGGRMSEMLMSTPDVDGFPDSGRHLVAGAFETERFDTAEQQHLAAVDFNNVIFAECLRAAQEGLLEGGT